MASKIDEYIAPIEAIREHSDIWRKGCGTLEAGVYILLKDDEVVYAGQAISIAWRLIAHSKSDKVWNKYYDIEVEDKKTRNDVEAYYIRRYNPIFNRKDERGSKDVEKALDGYEAPERIIHKKALSFPKGMRDR